MFLVAVPFATSSDALVSSSVLFLVGQELLVASVNLNESMSGGQDFTSSCPDLGAKPRKVEHHPDHPDLRVTGLAGWTCLQWFKGKTQDEFESGGCNTTGI